MGSTSVVVTAAFIMMASAGLARCVSARTSAAPELSSSHRTAVAQALAGRSLGVPEDLRVEDDHCVVADYVLGTLGEGLDAASLKRFGEARLLAIRQALLPFGFRVYQVNVRGAKDTQNASWQGIARATDHYPPEWESP